MSMSIFILIFIQYIHPHGLISRLFHGRLCLIVVDIEIDQYSDQCTDRSVISLVANSVVKATKPISPEANGCFIIYGKVAYETEISATAQ